MVAQVITIVNQSGKVVKTSKTLVNVFKEAKGAYAERKAELKAERVRKHEQLEAEWQLERRAEVLTIADGDSRASSRRGSEDSTHRIRRKPVPHHDRPPIERGYSDSFYTNDAPSPRSRKSSSRPSPLRFDSNGRISTAEPRAGELVRRHTSGLELHEHTRPRTPTRSASLDDIDMDLAYGYLPPRLPERRNDAALEIREKMTALQRLLEECNCLQHSAVATIDNLQKNPDALAAVALTLAEISNLATKLAPGALMAMKGSFPAIIALLASPQFAIAAGVGVGVTIIAFGGYKIIKKIQARKENSRLLEAGEPSSPAESVDELREIDRIELWRRGIEAESVGTSVDREFVTPVAGRTLIEEGKLREGDLKSSVSKKSRKSKKKEKGSEVGSESSSKKKVKVKKEKEKEPSGLRMLFKGHSKSKEMALA
nr:hypothetical protein B0A51_10129 [Rachicladosporium sp. CCFEE 5018]